MSTYTLGCITKEQKVMVSMAFPKVDHDSNPIHIYHPYEPSNSTLDRSATSSYKSISHKYLHSPNKSPSPPTLTSFHLFYAPNRQSPAPKFLDCLTFLNDLYIDPDSLIAYPILHTYLHPSLCGPHDHVPNTKSHFIVGYGILSCKL